ncbi:MAG: 4-hydroxy-tetrahydrodipicolinate synthase [Bermanella sp.]|nr:4-hydroxy-tetrahydrodipicolinate synthase [Bermanella sp.]|tara:strand:- start:1505 stop:2380 length:876 start_codon:yes stop_codon:yes gene_type:complete
MITGSIVALVTPMEATGAVDWNALKKLVEMHIEKGTASIVAVGTSGESATLDPEEHLEVIGQVVNWVAGRIPVIAGTGANSTSEAIHLTKEAQRLGADAVLLVTPYYNKPTQEGLFLHHKAIAEASSIPQILYNVPGRTACDMLPETVERLAQFDNIVGIKEATGDIDRARDVIARVGDKMAVYSGDDETAYELILAGGKGNISVTANVAPEQMAKLCALALEGKTEESKAMNDELMGLHNAMFLESNPIPVKWALHEMGLISPAIRLPLTQLSEPLREPLRQALSQWKLV